VQARLAKENALKAELAAKDEREKALLEALKEKSKGSTGADRGDAMSALNAARYRQKMDPAKRERARMRWKLACRRVMSPAAKMKRALGSMLNKKVDKTQTVVSRMEKAEEELKRTNHKLHQVEKLLHKMKRGEGKSKSTEAKTQKDIGTIAKQSTKCMKLFDELSMAILGTSVNIAVEAINAIDNQELYSPLVRDEPAHRDSVVKSVR
jgi:hypothetical protein